MFIISDFFLCSFRKKSLDLENLHHATLGVVPDGTGELNILLQSGKFLKEQQTGKFSKLK
jgi:hypothetical protein